MDKKKIKYHIAGYEFVLEDQIAQSAKLVQWGKALIDQAVKASPEASMAWCGICLILPLFTQSSATEQANRAGFAYVTARMHYYVALEPLLFPKNQDPTAIVPEDLKEAFEKNVVDLYQHILEFQFRSVLRFFRNGLRNLGRDLIQREDWDGMLSKVQQLENTLDGDFKKINNAVPSALYNSAEDQHIQPCQQGTRVSIRNQITAWANDISRETLFWVYGPAGTGKSTISRSIAQSLADTGLLGASYFFRRGKEGRNSASRFFPTIASQLIATVPTFKRSLRESLEKPGNTELETKALGEQFKTLILTPLSQVFTDTSQPILNRVIVIDALDECEGSKDIRIICDLLSQLQELSTVRLRVFLTSRSAYPIVGAFRSLQSKHSLSLLEDFSEETKADISTFLIERFATIKANNEITGDPWPDPKDLDRLITLATNPSPLFIYAATLCRFVDDGTGKKNPVKRLERWLKDCDSNTSQLNQIYVPILQDLFGTVENEKSSDGLDSEEKSQLLRILGSIILLPTPLPAPALAALLGMDESSVNHWLRNLHAVLNIPGDREAPVEILHKSFSDFLLGQEGTGTAEFRVNAAESHAVLASKCIQRMENGLSKDICSVRDPGKPRYEIDKAIIASHIPPDLEYACLYWVYHLQHSGKRITDSDELCIFLHAHFLHWLESLSWMRKISEGPNLRAFVHDAKRFVLYNRSVIEQAPLQIYCSALIFAPEKSIVRRQFKKCIPTWIQVKSRVQENWTSAVQTLEGHKGRVFSIAFSPDGKQLASASEDGTLASASGNGTVRLWDTATGAALQTLEGHKGRIRSIAFSPDSKQLASASGNGTTLKGHKGRVRSITFSPDGKQLGSASDDKTVRLWDTATGAALQTLKAHKGRDETVRLWDTATGAALQTLEGHQGRVRSIAFSPDGKQLASASDDKTVRLWDPATGAALQTLEGHDDWVHSITFSPDGKQLASVSASEDETVRLWDTATGAALQTLKGHEDWVYSITFSPDGKQLASASDDTTVRLWDTATGAALQTLEGHKNLVHYIAFSPDGKQLASVSGDRTVRLWDPATGTALQTLEGHKDLVYSIAFSPDGKQLASASGDETVRLWDTATGTALQTLKGHKGTVYSIAFSPDGKRLASASGDKIIRLWDTATGAALQALEGKGWAIAFSPDGKQLASTSNDKTVRLWDPATGAQLQTLELDSLEQVRTLFVSNDWILEEGEGILWLPPDYRTTCVAVWDGMVVLGHSSGRISFLEFEPGLKTV
ncbi:WD40-repeat-containing domain protein [Cenococcum geophilum]